MGRTTTAGVYKTPFGFDVDKNYRGKRIRHCGFQSITEAREWLIEELDRVRLQNIAGVRQTRLFQDAAAWYLEKYRDKASLVSDVYHLKAVMPYIGTLSLDRVHNDTLAAFIAARKAEGRKCKTINLSLAAVRRILNLAARDWRDDNGKTWLA